MSFRISVKGGDVLQGMASKFRRIEQEFPAALDEIATQIEEQGLAIMRSEMPEREGAPGGPYNAGPAGAFKEAEEALVRLGNPIIIQFYNPKPYHPFVIHGRGEIDMGLGAEEGAKPHPMRYWLGGDVTTFLVGAVEPNPYPERAAPDIRAQARTEVREAIQRFMGLF